MVADREFLVQLFNLVGNKYWIGPQSQIRLPANGLGYGPGRIPAGAPNEKGRGQAFRHPVCPEFACRRGHAGHGVTTA